MTSQTRSPGSDPAYTYDDRRATITALLVAVVGNAAIIGLFMFITWFAYNSS